MSAGVVSRERLKRTEPWATSSGTPMASRTGEGSSEPELHAAPAEAHTPCSLRSMRRASASRRGKPMLVVFHNRGTIMSS
jgi:hypothetical protein